MILLRQSAQSESTEIVGTKQEKGRKEEEEEEEKNTKSKLCTKNTIESYFVVAVSISSLSLSLSRARGR
jgi:hypothetical protein